jgi:hypothetical protein
LRDSEELLVDGWWLLAIMSFHPSRKIAEMERKMAIFQVQGTDGKRDAKNKKIAGKIAEWKPHTKATKVAKKAPKAR